MKLSNAAREWLIALICGVVIFLIVALCIFIAPPTALAAPTQTAPPRTAAAVHVPEAAALYRHDIEQAAGEVWGVQASPARLAAQIHQESSFDPGARSNVGAQGLAQFMPATAKWIAQKFHDRLGDFDPWDPRQAALAAAIYDQWLVQRNPGRTQCDCWSFGLSAYNGGEARLHAEQALAHKAGKDSLTWFGDVARYRARSLSAWRQNRGYVSRILLVLEPAYIDAGWAGTAVCST